MDSAGNARHPPLPASQSKRNLSILPSQDNTNQKLWLFEGSSIVTPPSGYSSIRSSGNFHSRDSWQLSRAGDQGNFYTANKPTNQFFNLSPLFSSTNNPKDIESIKVRLLKNPWVHSRGYSGWTFSSNATNAPTMRRFVRGGGGPPNHQPETLATKPIGSILMNDTASFDEMGIRGTSGGNLVYSNAHRFEWLGAGIMDKPISDFPHYPDAFGINPSWDGRTRKIPLILFIVAVESLCVFTAESFQNLKSMRSCLDYLCWRL